MKFVLIIALLLGIMSFASFANERGKEMYTKLTCVACHGEDGRGMVRKKDKISKKTGKYKYRKGDMMPGFENYPKLAGQSSVYLYNQMKDIFDGKRTNGMSNAMSGIKIMIDKTATDEDLKAIADYLSKVK